MRLFIYILLSTISLSFTYSQTSSNYSPDIRFKNLSIHDGLSQSQINCITQDDKGFIWIGTQDGLNRYDGYEFIIYKNYTKKKNAISGNYIYDVLYENGHLWVATDRGLDRINLLTNSVDFFKHNPKSHQSISSDQPVKLFRDKSGKIWVADANGKISIYDYQTKFFKTLQWKSISSAIHCFNQDSLGNIWIGTDHDGYAIINAKNDIIEQNSILETVKTICFDHGYIWIGGPKGAKLLKNLLYYAKDETPTWENPNVISTKHINKIMADPNGTIWVATEGEGVYKISIKDNFKNYEIKNFKTDFSKNKSLIDNTIHDLLIDYNNIVWIGTSNGISQYPNRNFFIKSYNYIEDQNQILSNNVVWSILEDKKRDLWVGTRMGLTQYNGETQKHTNYFNSSNSEINQNILSILEDRDGRLWIGTAKELILATRDANNKIIGIQKIFEWKKSSTYENRVYKIYQHHQGHIMVGTKYGLAFISRDLKTKFFVTEFRSEDKKIIPLRSIRDFYTDEHQHVWMGTERGIYTLTNVNIGSQSVQIQNNLPLIENQITCLLMKKHVLWAGTYGNGIIKVDMESLLMEKITEEEGLSNNVVYAILPSKNDLWISTNRGLTVYNLKERKCRFITNVDGLQSNEFNTGASFKSRDGNLFFGGINGFDIIYPYYRVFDPKAPTPVITEFKANNKEILDGQNVSYTNKITLRHSQNNISIRFSGLHFFTSDKNYYYYKLNGFDDAWNYSKNNHPIIYNNLDPGKYTFLLKGCNSDDICSVPLETQIEIKPALWQTTFFKVFLAILFGALIYIGVRTRINIVDGQKRALEVLVQRRTKEVLRQKEQIEVQKREIEEQKKKAEDLLRKILPEQTVSQLQTYGSARALSYRMATVMFTDFKGFTRIAENLRPEQLLKQLDGYFSTFDALIDKHHVEKIKTIGDSYMAVGGIPIRNKSNPFDVVLAALEIIHFIDEQKNLKLEQGEKPWEIRIGIHTGELIAGVIGSKRFAYDIWGDTVNVANRLETACEVGKINVSGQTYLQIKDFFNCSYRGKIEAKNKGYIDMYYVSGLKAEYSIDQKGVFPNQHFKDSIEMYLFGNILNYKKAEKAILQRLKTELPQNLYYHSVNHTIDVKEAAVKIAVHEGFNNQDIMLLKVAALYHDSGFVKQYGKHEEIGAKMAEDELPRYGFTETQIKTIQKLIMATSFPYKPETHLEMVLCDADLDYLGRDDFFEISDKLKREYIERGMVKNEIEFDKLQIDFLTSHSYFTPSTIAKREKQKQRHLDFIKQRYQQSLERPPEQI